MMIEGARRVGKSYILIDFFKVGDDIKDLFKNYKDNLDMLGNKEIRLKKP